MKNNPEWLEPLKHRPDLLMDEFESERLERVLRGEQGKRKALLLPAILVSSAVLIAFLLFIPGLLQGEPSLSADLQESLQAFEQIGEPTYHLTELPFEAQTIVSNSGTVPWGVQYVDARYIGKSTETELISLQVYFDVEGDFSSFFAGWNSMFTTSDGLEVRYGRGASGLNFIWQENGTGFSILTRDISLSEEEIEQMIHSVEKYE